MKSRANQPVASLSNHRAMRGRRAFTARQYLIAAALVSVVSAGGFGGYMYYRMHTPAALAERAGIAMEQHDYTRAIEFLQQAMAKNPTGDVGVFVRTRMAKCLIAIDRETEARPFLQDALAIKPDSAEALDLMAETHTHIAFRKLAHAPKPLAEVSINDILGTVSEEVATLQKLPQDPRQLIAQAQLHRLAYMIIEDQFRQANMRLSSAKLARDPVAIDKAEKQIAALGNPSAHRDQADQLLAEALKQDPKNVKAAEFLVQYEYQDRHFTHALALYEQLKKDGVTSPDLVTTAANIMIADSVRQPVLKMRFADAQKELEKYLADNPKDGATTHVLVAIGQTMMQQDKVADAAAMADRAAKQSPGDLDAQILLINTKLREKKTAEALALVSPLTATNGNVKQIWYLLGLADTAAGDIHGAQIAFNKALALDPTYSAARRDLLKTDIRAGDNDGALLLAAQEIKEDRYFIPAWEVTALDYRKHGQEERAKGELLELAGDPELPEDARPEVIELLLQFNIPDAAKKLYDTLPPGDDVAMRLAARIAAAENRISEARALIAKDVAANPDNIDLRLQYVEVLMRSRLGPDARVELDKIVAADAKNPVSPADWLRVGRGYLYLRMPEKALAAAHQAIAKQPKNLDALMLQDQATAMLTGAPTTGPAGVSADQSTLSDTIRLAGAALEKKDYTAALGLARTGLSKDSANAPLHEISARAHAGLGQMDQAVKEVVAAAQAQPNAVNAFAVFVDLFPTSEGALKGIGYGSSLIAINPSFGNWAMGRLAEISGNPSGALTYYRAGLSNTSKTLDPGAAKNTLYIAVLGLEAQQKDLAALKTDADTFANEPAFAIGIRLLASEHLRMLGDPAGAGEQLDKLLKVLTNSPQPQVVIMIAQHWMAINHPERAILLLEKYLPAAGAADKPRDPQMLELYGVLLEKSDPEKALKVREELSAADPTSPQYKILVAQSQAAAGDEGGAFRTLDAAANLGQTGKELAATARLKLLITVGLLQQATDEMNGHKSAENDYASALAIGQSWAELAKPENAKAALSAIPAFAHEYSGAVATLAALDASAGRFDAAIGALSAKNVELSPELFQTYLRAGKTAEALELAKKQIALYPANSVPWRSWTIFAATAAREAHQYGDAVTYLNTLDADTRKAAAFDIALLQLLQNKPEDASKTADAITDEAPTYNRSTIILLANSPAKLPTGAGTLLGSGPASTVYAFLSAVRSDVLPPELTKNSRIILGDVSAVMTDLAATPDNMAPRLRQLALAQRLVEYDWDTSALDVLDGVDKSPPNTTLAFLLRHRALRTLKRDSEAAAIADKIAALAKAGAVPPSARILLAAVAAQNEDYTAAIAALDPLIALNRPDVLTTLATFYEKQGQLDKAIALNRQVRQIDPNNILAANNLAYTLVAAHPKDKAALSEAKTAIEFAIAKAPGIPTFQDTLAWIEILSGDPAAGAKRLCKALPNLRLEPAAHYHLGIAYAKTGQTDLARLHLQNVQALSQSKTPIPEISLANEALKALTQN